MIIKIKKKVVEKALKRIIALLLSIGLVLSDSVAFAAAGMPQASVSFQTTDNAFTPPEVTHQALDLPKELGKVEEYHQGVNGKTIIFIQDSHDSLEAQLNIAKMIDYLVAGGEIQSVLEEGYEGDVPTDEYFSGVGDEETKEKISYLLLDALRLGGAEFAHINRKAEFNLIGADNLELQLSNIQWYQRMARNQGETLKELSDLETHIKNMLHRSLPNELMDYIRLKEKFNDGEMSLVDLLRRSHGNLSARMGETEFAKKFSEIRKVVSVLLRDPEESETGIHEIDGKRLFEEIEQLDSAFVELYGENKDQKTLFEYYKIIGLIKRLNQLEVTPNEFDAVRDALESFSTEKVAKFIAEQTKRTVVLSKQWEKNIESAIRFYETAEKRDEVVEENIKRFINNSKEEKAVLVFGGFHKERIREILKRSGLSYYIVTPEIKEISDRHRKYYKHIMAGGLHPFEIAQRLSEASRALSFIAMHNRSEARRMIEKLATAVKEAPSIVDLELLRSAVTDSLVNEARKEAGERVRSRREPPKEIAAANEAGRTVEPDEIINNNEEITARNLLARLMNRVINWVLGLIHPRRRAGLVNAAVFGAIAACGAGCEPQGDVTQIPSHLPGNPVATVVKSPLALSEVTDLGNGEFKVDFQFVAIDDSAFAGVAFQFPRSVDLPREIGPVKTNVSASGFEKMQVEFSDSEFDPNTIIGRLNRQTAELEGILSFAQGITIGRDITGPVIPGADPARYDPEDTKQIVFVVSHSDLFPGLHRGSFMVEFGGVDVDPEVFPVTGKEPTVWPLVEGERAEASVNVSRNGQGQATATAILTPITPDTFRLTYHGFRPDSYAFVLVLFDNFNTPETEFLSDLNGPPFDGEINFGARLLQGQPDSLKFELIGEDVDIDGSIVEAKDEVPVNVDSLSGQPQVVSIPASAITNQTGFPSIRTDNVTGFVMSVAEPNDGAQASMVELEFTLPNIRVIPIILPEDPEGMVDMEHMVSLEGDSLIVEYPDGTSETLSVGTEQSHLLDYSVTESGIYIVGDQRGNYYLEYHAFSDLQTAVPVDLPEGVTVFSSQSIIFVSPGIADITGTDRITRRVDLANEVVLGFVSPDQLHVVSEEDGYLVLRDASYEEIGRVQVSAQQVSLVNYSVTDAGIYYMLSQRNNPVFYFASHEDAEARLVELPAGIQPWHTGAISYPFPGQPIADVIATDRTTYRIALDGEYGEVVGIVTPDLRRVISFPSEDVVAISNGAGKELATFQISGGQVSLINYNVTNNAFYYVVNQRGNTVFEYISYDDLTTGVVSLPEGIIPASQESIQFLFPGQPIADIDATDLNTYRVDLETGEYFQVSNEFKSQIPDGYLPAMSNSDYAYAFVYKPPVGPGDHSKDILTVYHIPSRTYYEVDASSFILGLIHPLVDVSPDDIAGGPVVTYQKEQKLELPVETKVQIRRLANLDEVLEIAEPVESNLSRIAYRGDIVNVSTTADYGEGTLLLNRYHINLAAGEVRQGISSVKSAGNNVLSKEDLAVITFKQDVGGGNSRAIMNFNVYDASRGSDQMRLLEARSISGYDAQRDHRFSFTDIYRTPNGNRIVSVGAEYRLSDYALHESILIDMDSDRQLSLRGAIQRARYRASLGIFDILVPVYNGLDFVEFVTERTAIDLDTLEIIRSSVISNSRSETRSKATKKKTAVKKKASTIDAEPAAVKVEDATEENPVSKKREAWTKFLESSAKFIGSLAKLVEGMGKLIIAISKLASRMAGIYVVGTTLLSETVEAATSSGITADVTHPAGQASVITVGVIIALNLISSGNKSRSEVREVEPKTQSRRGFLTGALASFGAAATLFVPGSSRAQMPVPEGFTVTASNPNFAYRREVESTGPQTDYRLYLSDLTSQDPPRLVAESRTNYYLATGTIGAAVTDFADVSPDGRVVVYEILDVTASPYYSGSDNTYVQRVQDTEENVSFPFSFRSVSFTASEAVVAVNREFPEGTHLEETHTVRLDDLESTPGVSKVLEQGSGFREDETLALIGYVEPSLASQGTLKVSLYDATNGPDQLNFLRELTVGHPFESTPSPLSYLDAYTTPSGRRVVSIGVAYLISGYYIYSSLIVDADTGAQLSLSGAIRNATYEGRFATYEIERPIYEGSTLIRIDTVYETIDLDAFGRSSAVGPSWTQYRSEVRDREQGTLTRRRFIQGLASAFVVGPSGILIPRDIAAGTEEIIHPDSRLVARVTDLLGKGRQTDVVLPAGIQGGQNQEPVVSTTSTIAEPETTAAQAAAEVSTLPANPREPIVFRTPFSSATTRHLGSGVFEMEFNLHPTEQNAFAAMVFEFSREVDLPNEVGNVSFNVAADGFQVARIGLNDTDDDTSLLLVGAPPGGPLTPSLQNAVIHVRDFDVQNPDYNPERTKRILFSVDRNLTNGVLQGKLRVQIRGVDINPAQLPVSGNPTLTVWPRLSNGQRVLMIPNPSVDAQGNPTSIANLRPLQPEVEGESRFIFSHRPYPNLPPELARDSFSFAFATYDNGSTPQITEFMPDLRGEPFNDVITFRARRLTGSAQANVKVELIGTSLDPFGNTVEVKDEVALIGLTDELKTYSVPVPQITNQVSLPNLRPDNAFGLVLSIASAFEEVEVEFVMPGIQAIPIITPTPLSAGSSWTQYRSDLREEKSVIAPDTTGFSDREIGRRMFLRGTAAALVGTCLGCDPTLQPQPTLPEEPALVSLKAVTDLPTSLPEFPQAVSLAPNSNVITNFVHDEFDPTIVTAGYRLNTNRDFAGIAAAYGADRATGFFANLPTYTFHMSLTNESGESPEGPVEVRGEFVDKIGRKAAFRILGASADLGQGDLDMELMRQVYDEEIFDWNNVIQLNYVVSPNLVPNAKIGSLEVRMGGLDPDARIAPDSSLTDADITPMPRLADGSLPVWSGFSTTLPSEEEGQDGPPTSRVKVVTLDNDTFILLVEGLEDFAAGGTFASFKNFNDDTDPGTVDFFNQYPGGIVFSAQGVEYTDEDGNVYEPVDEAEFTLEEAKREGEEKTRSDNIFLTNIGAEAGHYRIPVEALANARMNPSRTTVSAFSFPVDRGVRKALLVKWGKHSFVKPVIANPDLEPSVLSDFPSLFRAQSQPGVVTQVLPNEREIQMDYDLTLPIEEGRDNFGGVSLAWKTGQPANLIDMLPDGNLSFRVRTPNQGPTGIRLELQSAALNAEGNPETVFQLFSDITAEDGLAQISLAELAELNPNFDFSQVTHINFLVDATLVPEDQVGQITVGIDGFNYDRVIFPDPTLTLDDLTPNFPGLRPLDDSLITPGGFGSELVDEAGNPVLDQNGQPVRLVLTIVEVLDQHTVRVNIIAQDALNDLPPGTVAFGGVSLPWDDFFETPSTPETIDVGERFPDMVVSVRSRARTDSLGEEYEPVQELKWTMQDSQNFPNLGEIDGVDLTNLNENPQQFAAFVEDFQNALLDTQNVTDTAFVAQITAGQRLAFEVTFGSEVEFIPIVNLTKSAQIPVRSPTAAAYAVAQAKSIPVKQVEPQTPNLKLALANVRETTGLAGTVVITRAELRALEQDQFEELHVAASLWDRVNFVIVGEPVLGDAVEQRRVEDLIRYSNVRSATDLPQAVEMYGRKGLVVEVSQTGTEESLLRGELIRNLKHVRLKRELGNIIFAVLVTVSNGDLPWTLEKDGYVEDVGNTYGDSIRQKFLNRMVVAIAA